MKKVIGAVVTIVLLASCVPEEPSERPMPTRPVTVIQLNERDYDLERELTGVVSLYREQQIGFEVGGRVIKVLDIGLEVRGPAYNEKGELIRQGDAIAAIEGTRYNTQVEGLQAQLDTSRRDLQAVEAQVTLAKQTLVRQQNLLEQGAGAQQAVDNARGAFDQANAQVAARRAAVRAVEQKLVRASEDLGDAVLFAPFSGRVTAVHIAEGAVVDAGTPIVTLTLMDPVRVQVEVSADTERDLQTGDRAVIFPKDPFDADRQVPVNALVFEKSTVADPRFRTFRIDLIARNLRRHIDERDSELEGLPTTNIYMPVVREFQGEPGPLFIHTDTLLVDDGKTYVLRLPGVSFNAGAARSAVGKHIPEQIEVTLGDQYTTVVKWNFRSIVDSEDLAEGDFLIVDPKPEYVSGVAIGRPQWLLRPRDLVPVRFTLSSTPTGFYVPNRAITLLGDVHNVYRVDQGVARATPVTVLNNVDEHRRVEGANIGEGTQIIVGGVHFVSDGQQVSVAEVLEE